MKAAALPKEQPPLQKEVSFDAALAQHGLEPVRRGRLSTLQVNVGRILGRHVIGRCNLTILLGRFAEIAGSLVERWEIREEINEY